MAWHPSASDLEWLYTRLSSLATDMDKDIQELHLESNAHFMGLRKAIER